MADSLRSVCGHSMHFAKFSILIFSKDYRPHIFHPISTKRYEKYESMVIPGGGSFLATCQILKRYGILKIKSPQQHCTLPLAINLSWFHLAKGQKESQGPCATSSTVIKFNQTF